MPHFLKAILTSSIDRIQDLVKKDNNFKLVLAIRRRWEEGEMVAALFVFRGSVTLVRK